MKSIGKDTRHEWRQPAPRKPADGASRGPAALLKRALAWVFEASEDENHLTILRRVARDVPRERVLDLGCYNGAFTKAIGEAAHALQLVGVEWLPEHAAEARRRGVDVLEADLNEQLPFEDASFDLVHANQVIEHLRSTDSFLREVRRVCAPDGRVILSTNNLSGWHNVMSLAMGFQPLPAHVSDEIHVGNPLDPRRGMLHADAGQTHLRLFTNRALVELCAHHGLRLVASSPNGYYPLPPALARIAVRIDSVHTAFLVVVLEPIA